MKTDDKDKQQAEQDPETGKEIKLGMKKRILGFSPFQNQRSETKQRE